jgi:hypothetical protein
VDSGDEGQSEGDPANAITIEVITMMELFTVPYLWNTILTLAAFIGSILWKQVMQHIHDLKQENSKLREQMAKTREEYAKKDEITAIQSHIDSRFAEMRDFFTTLVKHNG